jgi:hypothetical protein
MAQGNNPADFLTGHNAWAIIPMVNSAGKTATCDTLVAVSLQDTLLNGLPQYALTTDLIFCIGFDMNCVPKLIRSVDLTFNQPRVRQQPWA